MQFKSEVLNKVFDFVTYEKEDNDKVLRIISHDSIEDAIHNGIDVQVGFAYAYDVMIASGNHFVVACTMTDSTGRKVIGIGESVPNTLETNIAKNYPMLIATQRAFDRAAIRYLNLPGKVFSNTEIPVENGNIATDYPSVTDDTVTSVVVDSEDDEYPVTDSSVTVVTQSDTDEDLFIEDEPLSEVDVSDEVVIVDDEPISDNDIADTEGEPVVIDGDDGSSFVGTRVITMNGRYKTKGLTIEQIAKTDKGWLEWIAGDTFNATNDVAKADKAAIKEYLSLSK